MEIQQFKFEFNRLRGEFEELLAQVQVQNKQEAPEFNVFHSLGVTTREVRHSALLANLLNPDGDHAQGHLFLTKFLERCANKFPDFPMPKGDIRRAAWYIERERGIRGKRLDIVIRSPSLRYMVIIENKVRAGIDKGQLDDYETWLKKEKTHYPNQAMIILTPIGERANSSWFPLSYESDIKYWLESCLQLIEPPHLKETLNQYLELIPLLSREVDRNIIASRGGGNAAARDGETIAFLAQPDNLEIAFEIAEYAEAIKSITNLQAEQAPAQKPRDKIKRFLSQPDNLPTVRVVLETIEQVKDRLQRDFWLALADSIRLKWAQTGKDRTWQFWMQDEEYLCHDYIGLTMYPRNVKPGQLLMVVMLSQASHLYYGVRWTVRPKIGRTSRTVTTDKPESWTIHYGGTKLAKVPQVDGMLELENQLLKMGFEDPNPYWLLNRTTDYQPRSQEFQLWMATDKNDLVKTIAQMLCDFLEEIEPYIHEANRDLAPFYPSKFGAVTPKD
jgi:hypothetical protein